MNIRFESNKVEKKVVLPEVGEVWKHDNCPAVYMCINKDASAVFPDCPDSKFFASVNLCDGIVVRTLKRTENVVMLDAECVIKGASNE